jgi:hypothetical protein
MRARPRKSVRTAPLPSFVFSTDNLSPFVENAQNML